MVVDANWFQITAEPNFTVQLMPLRGKPGLNFLQIGVWKGDASLWLLENILTHDESFLYDVDPWGKDESYTELDQLNPDWSEVYREYLSKIEPHIGKVGINTVTSREFFRDWFAQEHFDFIYIDGAHDAISTLEDIVGAYQLLKPGGLLAIDDYAYQSDDGNPLKAPAVAINAARVVYERKLIPLVVNSQVWFIKALR